jgi:group I intron endonuclease
MSAGIYEILNTTSGKRYIGSASNLKKRWRDHSRELNRGMHYSILLQRAWNKYGGAAFKFLPILTCAKSMLLFYEQQLLDKARPEYNINPTAGSRVGARHSPETRAKISAALVGRKLSAEHCASLSIAHLANPGRGTLGWKHTPETIAKMSAALNLRRAS